MTVIPEILTNSNTSGVLANNGNDALYGDNVMLAPNTGDAVYGDKVMRDKYVTLVQSDVSLELVKPVLLDVAHKLAEGEKEQAVTALNTLSLLGNLNSSTKVAIACLKAVSSLELSGEEKLLITKNYQLKSNSDEDFQGYLNAAAIYLLKEEKSAQELKDFYCALPENICSDIAYYSTLNHINSIDDISRKLDTFSLPVLHLLLEKSFASGQVDVCQKVFDELKKNSIFTDLSGQEVILDCISINKFNVYDYLLLSTEQKQYLDNVIDRLIELVGGQEVLDNRYISIAGQLLHYTQLSNSKLIKLVQDHRSLLNQIDFRGKEVVVSFLDHEKSGQHSQTQKSAEDLSLEIIKDVKLGVFSPRNIALLCELKDTEWVESTLNELLNLERTNECLGCYCALAAKSAEFLEKKQFPSVEIETILTDDFKEIRLHSGFLVPTARLLSMAGYHGLALCALDLLFKNSHPWISDPYVQYLSLLYENEQYNSLNSRLSTMQDQEQFHSEISNLKSFLATKEDKFSEAVKLIEEQIQKYQDKVLSESEKKHCIYLWVNLLINLRKSTSHASVAEYVERIPISIFSTPDDELAWELITFFGERYIEVEDIVLTWFFKDPNKYANQLFNVVMSIPSDVSTVGFNSKIFKIGYLYTENCQSKYRIVVDDKNLAVEHPQYLIHSSTDLANTLQIKAINNYFLYRSKHCVMKETLPPTVAAYRIAIEILDNDENQCFSLVSLPENPTAENIVNVINSIVERGDRYTPAMKECFSGNIPCIFKYKFIKGSNSYGKALTAILSKNIYMELFSDNNIYFNDSNSNDVVLDEISFAFLVVSGLSKKIEVNIHITSETAKKIKEWCSSYGDMEVVFDPQKDDFVPEYSEEKTENDLNLIGVTKELLEKCNVHNDRDYNVPLKLKILANELLTSSTKSSLGLAFTYGFSYFTVDNQLRGLLSRPEFIKVDVAPGDVNKFFFENSDAETIGDLLLLHQHNFNLFVPWEAFDELCANGSEKSLYKLVLFIRDISRYDNGAIIHNIEKLTKRIFFKCLTDSPIQASTRLLESLFIKLVDFSGNSTEIANVFLNMLPSSLLQPFESEFLGNISYQELGQATKMTTDAYIDAFSDAVRDSSQNLKKIWIEIEALC
ncbi:hypothetical protein [Photobacterium galatheae]|uniref:Uncharacterized protein n=1 Tax=Photobacterium galatheae TaxID=1654360 RepID=A0A066RUT3_9GAMM|nr:hypothetical protein [Photobacterium galatheae]KDM92876.1 hypothetical protein EA58_03735 [Photobacterium galatheae]MCM0148159.1 hypothetical protein [Photobacterium galatheae]